jgi:hypothetical protein
MRLLKSIAIPVAALGLLLVAVTWARGTASEAAGAKPARADRTFWSFRPLVRVEPPAVSDQTWAGSGVDRFLRAAQETNGLSPAPRAERGTLVRRAYFGVIGLPPTPQELREAIEDESPDWYERLVDRLLASPHYGERWGRHWLDVARYADSDGYEADGDRPTAWRYRDFVIRALNDDMPYDQFVRLQLAGDELAPAGNAEAAEFARSGTGFIAAATVIMGTTGTKRYHEQNRYNELDDILSTTSSAFLGLTVGCARCHDHKFDPISAREYYRMLAAFTTTRREPPPPAPLPGGEANKFKPEDLLGAALGVTDASPTPATSYLLARGDVDAKVEEVTLGFPAVLTSPDANGSPDRWRDQLPGAEGAKTTRQRAAMAAWITDAEHGAGALAARVIINRIWQHHFGDGLVRTPGDFGTQGERPTHPELLDWLATELVANGWKLKSIHRLILTSSAYRQGTAFDPAKATVDPDNRLLWRRRPLRGEAEVVRDAILAVSGQLRREVGRPPVKPALPPETSVGRDKDGIARPKEDGPDQWRRTVYLFTKRSRLTPALTTFDAPNAAESCARRTVSTVPTQALALLNDPFVRTQAGYFAKRCLSEAERTPGAQVRHAYVLALSREPSERELQRATEFLGESVTEDAMTDLCHVLFTSNEFAYVD